MRQSDGRSCRPVADNDELDTRQPGQSLDHQVMALQGDKVADRQKGRASKAEGLPRRLAMTWAKECQIHPVAQDSTRPGATPSSTKRCFRPFETAIKPSARRAAQRVQRRGPACRRSD